LAIIRGSAECGSDFGTWSFLMASAHGAGLMLLSFVMARPGEALASGHEHAAHAAAAPASFANAAMALTAHTPPIWR
jgi:hypothetical protein